MHIALYYSDNLDTLSEETRDLKQVPSVTVQAKYTPWGHYNYSVLIE